MQRVSSGIFDGIQPVSIALRSPVKASLSFSGSSVKRECSRCTSEPRTPLSSSPIDEHGAQNQPKNSPVRHLPEVIIPQIPIPPRNATGLGLTHQHNKISAEFKCVVVLTRTLSSSRIFRALVFDIPHILILHVTSTTLYLYCQTCSK